MSFEPTLAQVVIVLCFLLFCIRAGFVRRHLDDSSSWFYVR
jgi:hypothetical protein